jgi:hypothetical protein
MNLRERRTPLPAAQLQLDRGREVPTQLVTKDADLQSRRKTLRSTSNGSSRRLFTSTCFVMALHSNIKQQQPQLQSSPVEDRSVPTTIPQLTPEGDWSVQASSGNSSSLNNMLKVVNCSAADYDRDQWVFI